MVSLFKPNVPEMLRKRNISGLIKALNNSDNEIHIAARDALIALGPLAVEDLIQALQHDSSKVRAAAAWALGDIGDQRAVPALIKSLYDRDTSVCINSVVGLGDLLNPVAVKPLIEAFVIDNDRVVQEIINALLKFKGAAVDELIIALHHPNDNVRIRAALVLGRLDDRRATVPFIRALKDQEMVVRQNAAWGLIGIADARALDALLAALDDPYEPVRQNAKYAIENLRLDANALPALIPAFQNHSGWVRELILKKLNEVGWQPENDSTGAIYWATKHDWAKCVEIGEPAVEVLIRMLKSEPNSGCIQALGSIASEQAIEPLVDFYITTIKQDFLENTNHDELLQSCQLALSNIGPPVITPLLQGLEQLPLYYDNCPVEMALKPIQLMSQAGIVDVLINITQNYEPKTIPLKGLMYVVDILGKRKDRRATEALINLFQVENQDFYLRLKILKALGNIRDERGVDIFLPIVENYAKELGSLVGPALVALGRIGDPRACSPVLEFLFAYTCGSLPPGYFDGWQDRIFTNRDYPWLAYFKDLHPLFLDYTESVLDLLGHTEIRTFHKGSEEDEAIYDRLPDDEKGIVMSAPGWSSTEYDLRRNLKALEKLCRMDTPVSSNLLHKVKDLPGHMFHDPILIAEKELKRRGDPAYNPGAYLAPDAWKIPEILCPSCGDRQPDSSVRCKKCGHKFI